MNEARRRQLLIAAGAILIPRAVRAQRTARPARIGWLGWTAGRPSYDPVPIDSLRAGLRERGWAEGKNLSIEVRNGDRDNGRELTAQLLQAGAELIVAQGPMIFPARAAAGFAPLVFTINGDPVKANLVASLSRPGGNLTGITALSAELAAKRLELLREAVPGAKRVAAIANQVHPGVEIESDATHAAAQRLGLSLRWVPVRSMLDFDAAFAAIAGEKAEALVAIPDTLINAQAKAVAGFAAARRIPAISGWAEFAEAGNLLSYGPSLRGFFRHTATYVDKLLRGAKPAELPIEQPTELELAVNVKTAEALGLKLPQSLLLRATRTIQ